MAGEAEHGGRTRKLAEHFFFFLLHKEEKQKEAGTGTMLQILKTLPSDALTLTNLLIQLLWPPKQSHKLGSKCKNT